MAQGRLVSAPRWSQRSLCNGPEQRAGGRAPREQGWAGTGTKSPSGASARSGNWVTVYFSASTRLRRYGPRRHEKKSNLLQLLTYLPCLPRGGEKNPSPALNAEGRHFPGTAGFKGLALKSH